MDGVARAVCRAHGAHDLCALPCPHGEAPFRRAPLHCQQPPVRTEGQAGYVLHGQRVTQWGARQPHSRPSFQASEIYRVRDGYPETDLVFEWVELKKTHRGRESAILFLTLFLSIFGLSITGRGDVVIDEDIAFKKGKSYVC